MDDSMSEGWQVGIDIGGTFTDVVAVHPASGETRCAKVATRTADRIEGLLAALDAVALKWAEVADLVHGTTMVTNAIVENDLADVALIATAGFGDTLAIGRQNRRHLYRLDLPPKITPQVLADKRFEITGRLDHEGNVLQRLDLPALDSLISDIEASGADAVAVSLMHAYANPEHEEMIGSRLRQKFPYVALSNRVNPEAREYERTATTVLSASVMPLAASYLDSLESAKPKGSRLHLFHSAGGMASPRALRDLPLGLALSGPAAGVAAAGRVAEELSIEHALSFDMGGTTTDVCLISQGRAEIASDRTLAERPLRQPMVAVESIGAGGGSIARLDHDALVVGPESAGADPGPACYGTGGRQPTVTDANLVLGYMDPERILGDGLRLQVAAAQAVLADLARDMNMSVEAAAAGVVTVANAAMVRALRRITVERGIDGRNCTLLAFGGAGPMHAVEVARAFGISSVVVPVHSSAFSALGCVSAEMSYSQQRTVRMRSTEWKPAKLREVRDTLRARLLQPLTAGGHEPVHVQIDEVAAVRYRGQSYAIEIAQPDFSNPVRLGRAFLDRHEELYGFATDEDWELVSIRLRARIPRSAHLTGSSLPMRPCPTPLRTSPCIFAGGKALPTPRYHRVDLAESQPIFGPAIVEDAWSTVVIPPGAVMVPDAAENLHIDVGADT